MQCLPVTAEYGGASTSRTAQGVTAVKACMLPPLVGCRVAVSQGAVSTRLTTNFADLAAQDNARELVTPPEHPQERSTLFQNVNSLNKSVCPKRFLFFTGSPKLPDSPDQ